MKAMMRASRKASLPAVKGAMRRIPREPGIMAPLLAKGEGAGSGAAEIFVHDCEVAVDEAEAIQGLSLGD